MTTILCILAGGQSRRFGSSKVALHVDGEPLLAWLARRLRPAFGGPCWVSVAPGAEPPGADAFDRRVVDAAPFGGPLSAIEAVLRVAPGDADVAIAAADMLCVTPEHLQLLRHTLCDAPHASVAMGRWAIDAAHRPGDVEPLPSLWRAGAGLRLIENARADGVTGPHQLAARREAVMLPLSDGDERTYLNINRVSDMAEVAAAIGARIEPTSADAE